MSELISSPQPEPAPRATSPSGPVAHDGLDGLHHPGIVVRYDAVTDPPDDPDADADEDTGEDVEADADPGDGLAGRIRAILGALGQSLFALSWACLRTAYRYPRWALVIVFSVVILGATALSRPGNPTPTAAIPPEKPAAASAGADERKAPEEGKTESASDQTALAKADSAPATETKEGKGGQQDRKTGEAAASAPAPPHDAASAPATKVADAGSANAAPDDKAPPAIDPPSTQKESVPAPPPLTERTVASLISSSSTGQAPAPAPLTPAPPESPTAPATDPPGPGSALPLLPGAESNLPPVSAAPPSIAAAQPPGSGPPAPGGEVKLTGGANPGDAPPPTPPSHDAMGGSAGTAQPTTESPSPGPPTPTSPTQPETPAPGLSPLPPAPALSETLERQGPAPKPDPPKTDPKNEVEPAKNERGHTEAAAGAGAVNDHQTPAPEAVHPPSPEVKPESRGEAGALELPPVGPASPAAGSEPPGLDAVRGERDNAGDAHKPGILKEDDLKPGHEAPSTGSPGGMSQPGTTDRPEVMTPPTGGGLPARDENVPNRAGAQEAPAPSAESPASEPTPPRSREAAARHEPIGGLGSSVSEPSVPTAQPARDLAEGGWVRIPNKGRIPSGSGVNPDAFGGAGGRDSDRAQDRRRQADPSPGDEPESPANRSADANERAVAESASATGLVAAARGVRQSGGSRADAGSTRVEPSLHIVERGENFWTISRLYYGTGRYYRALWRANSRKYPNIDEIHINDVVEIPAVEDLDPNDFERPNRRPIAGRDEGSARGLADVGAPEGAGPPRSYPTTRTARTSGGGEGIPVRRSAGAAPELELPASDAGAGPARVGRGASGDRSDPDEDRGPSTAIRSTARPRNTARVDRPVYKVRRYDTLRSIARDILGDPRRADEILDLNRNIIDDPTRLTTGQILELPEDADTRRLTVRDRYRGRD